MNLIFSMMILPLLASANPNIKTIQLPEGDGKNYRYSYEMKASSWKVETIRIVNNLPGPYKLGKIETWYYGHVTAETNCPEVLESKESCSLELTFRPRIVGIVSGQGAAFSDANFSFNFYANTY